MHLGLIIHQTHRGHAVGMPGLSKLLPAAALPTATSSSLEDFAHLPAMYGVEHNEGSVDSFLFVPYLKKAFDSLQ